MNGIIVVDKGPGLSSAQAIRPIKRCLPRGLRIGHTGTLDPFASGVLAIVLGNATRLSRHIMGMPKTYEAVVRLGLQTDTLDPTGEVVAQQDPGPYSPWPVLDAINSQKGRIEQMPPAFSALKVDGQRAYRLARAGETPELKPREVMVYGIDVQAIRWPRLSLRIRCGSGTYIRSIARDIGAALNLPAHLEALRRTSVGPFESDAVETLKITRSTELRLDEVEGLVRSMSEVINHLPLPQVHVDLEEAYRIVTGRPIQRAELVDLPVGSEIAILTTDAPDPCSGVLGLGEVEPSGWLKPRSVFSSSRAWVEEGFKSRLNRD